MPAGDNCQRKSLNLLLCNTDCCRNFFLSLVPSRTDVSGEFGGKAAVDLKSIPDRRSSSSRAAVTRAARRIDLQQGCNKGGRRVGPGLGFGSFLQTEARPWGQTRTRWEVGGVFHPERSGTSIHQYQVCLIQTPGHAFLHTAHPRKPAWN